MKLYNIIYERTHIVLITTVFFLFQDYMFPHKDANKAREYVLIYRGFLLVSSVITNIFYEYEKYLISLTSAQR